MELWYKGLWAHENHLDMYYVRLYPTSSKWGSTVLKGELRNRFNLISEERVKFCEQNSENLMKIGWKIRKLWHFEVSQFSQNISWPVDMNMQMSELMMSSPHYLPYILYIKFWKIQYFAHTCDSMSLISSNSSGKQSSISFFYSLIYMFIACSSTVQKVFMCAAGENN